MSATDADLKASGELVVGPLFSGKDNLWRDIGKEPPTSGFDDLTASDHGPHPPPTYNATFEGDQAFYVPIERYEGKHRYDPMFQWEPKEETKLVRKVCKFLQARLALRIKTDLNSWICGSAPGSV